MGQFKTKYLAILVFSAVINCLMLVPSWYMLQVYDRVLTSYDENTLLGLSLIALFIYLIYALLEQARGWILIEIAEALDGSAASILHGSQLTPQVPAHQRDGAVLNDLNTVKQFLTGQPMLAFLDAPWAFIYLAVIFLLNTSLGWISLASMLVLFLVAIANQRLTGPGLEKARDFAQQERRLLVNCSAALESIHVMGMRSAMQARLKEIRDHYLASLLVASGRGVNLSAVSKWIRVVIQSLALGYGAYLVIHEQMTGGMIIAGSILLGRALAPIDGVINSWKQWADFRKSFDTVNDVLASAAQQTHTVQIGKPRGALSLDGVSVKLRANGPPALKDINLTITAGQSVAVIGPSGAGKTTLLKTLAGVVQPSNGRALIDGSDLAFRDMQDLGPHMGYLGQDTALLAGKVSENIARFGAIDSQAVMAAANAAGAHEMLMALPAGYETELGNHGAGLSEGQKRRIGLARALYSEPTVVLLDEPGTALDEVAMTALVQTLAQLKTRGATVVFTTHQPSLAQLADVVVLMADGQLRLMGPRDEVFARLGKK